MADDREILREMWEGRLPVSFTLASDEVENERPDSVYLMVFRQTYFPLVTDKVSRFLSQYVDKETQGEMWLEFEGQPLKWHYPVGVLFDLLGNTESLPWNLIVHFQNFPEDEVMHCPSKDAVESHFMSVVKEADALKHRSHFINNMQKKDHKQMWSGVTNEKFDQFWSVNKRLMECSGEDMFKYIPFRIYQVDKPFTQKLCKPLTEEGYEGTLQTLLEQSLPELIKDLSSYRVIIQGIEPSLDTSVLWLSEHFSHPDNFLHICVIRKTDREERTDW